MMYDFVKEVTETLGGRVPGSPEEKQAQQMYKKRMLDFTDDVAEHHFEAPMNAKFASMKLFCLVYYAMLVLYWFNLPVATGIAIVSAIFFLGHVVTYRDWLDFLYPKGTSLNVTATLEPLDEVRSTILVAGHIDSVYEFQWWYRLKTLGGALTFISGLLFTLQAVYYAVVQFGGFDIAGWPQIGWWVLVALAPITIVMFTIHGKTKVDGASDNLSGVAVAMGTGSHFAHASEKGRSTLKHTRLKLVSFGAEEPGLKGSGAYVRDFKDQLLEDKAVLLNVDSVRLVDKLSIASSESNVLVRYPKDLIEKMKLSFEANGVPGRAFDVSIGASDAARFGMRGIPATTIVGIDTTRLDHTYHTRLDTIENLDPAALDKTRDILVHFISTWDEQLT